MATDLTAPAEPAFLKGLTHLQRAYVRALFEVHPGFGQGARAVRAAGYDCKDAAGYAQMAYDLSLNEKVQAAVNELGRRRMRSEHPAAVQTVVEVMTNPQTKEADRLKAAKMVLERADAIVTKTETTVNVTIDRDKSRRDAIKFMADRGATREKLIEDWGDWAVNEALPLEVIEGSFVVIEPPKSEEPKSAEEDPLSWMK